MFFEDTFEFPVIYQMALWHSIPRQCLWCLPFQSSWILLWMLCLHSSSLLTCLQRQCKNGPGTGQSLYSFWLQPDPLLAITAILESESGYGRFQSCSLSHTLWFSKAKAAERHRERGEVWRGKWGRKGTEETEIEKKKCLICSQHVHSIQDWSLALHLGLLCSW